MAVARGKGVNGVFGGRLEEGWVNGVRGRVGDCGAVREAG